MKRNGLHDYGIHNEGSDMRAHVDPGTKCVYVFPTRVGVELVRTAHYPVKPAFQPGVEGATAEGMCVPVNKFPKLRVIRVPDHIWDKANIQDSDSTTSKGDKAARIVSWLLRTGGFPLQCVPEIVGDVDLQYEGMDIIVNMKTRIQVKCDMGIAKHNNIFLQIAERNPLKRH